MTTTESPELRTTETMDAETLEALRGSIAKWQAIVDGTGNDLGSQNCPLCQRFMQRDDEARWTSCGNCPVTETTGQIGCINTPYDAYQDEPTRDNAREELDFLKSLLPSDPEPPDPDGECFRGSEYASALAEQQAQAKRLK